MGQEVYRIERDRARFREIVRGKLRRDLRKYLSTGELIGRQGGHSVSVPVPQIELPRFRYGDNSKQGVGQGPGEEGEPVSGEAGEGEGAGAAGEAEGQHILEVDVELEELAAMLGDELELPDIRPRHFKRTYKRALRRTMAAGEWDPARPEVVPVREDEFYRMHRSCPRPDSSAVIFHMMDVSGSMGREQKEIVRIKAFWIDTWLRSQYENLEVVYIVHDAVAKEVDQDTFFHLRESGGTKISSAYELCLERIQSDYRPEDWNIYPFHYSDGDNWSARDTERCVTLLRDELLPRVNQFCYGQVKSAYGSGQFKKDLDGTLGQEEALVTAAVNDRQEIPDVVRAFLGKGR